MWVNLNFTFITVRLPSIIIKTKKKSFCMRICFDLKLSWHQINESLKNFILITSFSLSNYAALENRSEFYFTNFMSFQVKIPSKCSHFCVGNDLKFWLFSEIILKSWSKLLISENLYSHQQRRNIIQSKYLNIVRIICEILFFTVLFTMKKQLSLMPDWGWYLFLFFFHLSNITKDMAYAMASFKMYLLSQ